MSETEFSETVKRKDSELLDKTGGGRKSGVSCLRMLNGWLLWSLTGVKCGWPVKCVSEFLVSAKEYCLCVRQCHRSVFFAVWIFARENIHCLAIWHLLLCRVNFCQREYIIITVWQFGIICFFAMQFFAAEYLLFGSLASASLPCEFLPERVYNYCLAVVSVSLPCEFLPERVYIIITVWQWYLFLCHVNVCQREYLLFGNGIYFFAMWIFARESILLFGSGCFFAMWIFTGEFL